jgi:hypothetical protein
MFLRSKNGITPSGTQKNKKNTFKPSVGTSQMGINLGYELKKGVSP